MSKIYIVSGGESGRCRCGHRSKKGEVYVLVEGERGDWTLCRECMLKNKMKGTRISIKDLRKRWFGEVSLADLLTEEREVCGV